ncbi:MAG TPA: LysM peptidoglycan-binding domain-containing protein [Candidatus Saccharimonadales bacterium]|nr:LysM peptidoglycan-binding domain-containing protein [Candidatus Saccharimonadales bacterium]
MQPGQSNKLYRRYQKLLSRKGARKRAIRFGLVSGNLVLIAAIVTFIIGSPHSGGAAAPAFLNSSSHSVAANPLDQLSSADIAVTVARVTSVPEATSVTNQADSEHALLAMSSASESVASKPEVVATALKSKADIVSYTTVAGDTVSGLATKYGVSADSIRWSNQLNGDSVAAGKKLVIPPVNGIVYTVKSGDTIDSLAQKYKADKQKIIEANDAEISGLKPGEQVLIPDGTVAAPAVVHTIAVASSFPWGGYSPIYGYNGYDYGYCTWYVANRVAVPSNWGNASSWAYYAGMSGWTVSSTPIPGAIAQTPYAAGGLGHVAYVEAVSADGTMMKYSDMNGLAGWGRVGYSDWVPISKFPHYIYH